VIPVENPTTTRTTYRNMDFAAGYLGFYVANDAVIMQGYGDAPGDRAAREIIENAYPDRIVEMIDVDGIAAGGGTVHCVTQQEPTIMK